MMKKIYYDTENRKYQVIMEALQKEKNEEYIVYQELFSDYELYVMAAKEFFNRFKREARQYNEPKHAEDIEEMPAEALMCFLDARTTREKIDVLNRIRKEINEHMINSIELSLDMPVGTGDIETRIDIIRRTLETHEKYEGRRLR